MLSNDKRTLTDKPSQCNTDKADIHFYGNHMVALDSQTNCDE